MRKNLFCENSWAKVNKLIFEQQQTDLSLELNKAFLLTNKACLLFTLNCGDECAVANLVYFFYLLFVAKI